MIYISVREASQKFSISERRIQKLCETKRIAGCIMVSGVWLIPQTAGKPTDERFSDIPNDNETISLSELCDMLSISIATGRNWIKLGKLIPDYTDKKIPFFTKEYASKLKKDLASGKNIALKSRRNKKFVSGNSLYNSYVSEDCQNLPFIQTLLSNIESYNIQLTDNIIQYIIADCALHLFMKQRNGKFSPGKSLLASFLQGSFELPDYAVFINDLIQNKKEAIRVSKDYPSLFSIDYLYESKEDILGLIYISCKNIGNRKATGVYYTPTRIVKKLISHLKIQPSDTFLDPCCGTGNFLLQLPEQVPFNAIYGNDVDSISIKVTRLNMALKYPKATVEQIYRQITSLNYLSEYNRAEFTYIIGNPPWGYAFTDEEKKLLRKKFTVASNTVIESYDVFIEQSLRNLVKNGELAFVLPEAVLNVKAHYDIRKIISAETNIRSIDFLGNAFDGVQCPCIILRIERTGKQLSTVGMKIDEGKNSFLINTKRVVNADYFSFITNDEEYSIIEKIKNNKNCTTLFGQADFALGIVTGNNVNYLSSTKTDNNEVILKGADICKYHIKPSNNYIVYKPESFQQVAPSEMYRAKEKLLYRFISNQLIFAYDDNQTLSLNSCNIVIPKIQNLNIKYILAILNSRVAQFIYKKEFNSVKVLRSHIENIPIPIIDETLQNSIMGKINMLIKGQELERAEILYDEIDSIISSFYGLSENDKEVIEKTLGKENKFLY